MSVSNRVALSFVRGEEKAIEKVYLEYKNLMYFIIAGYVENKDDCDDVLSDAFLKALEKKETLKDPSSLKNFLCAIAKNEAINFARKRSRELESEVIDEIYGGEDKKNRLLNELEPLLSNKETIVVYLRAVFSYSWEEIVKETGIPESTARRIYTQAKEKLRKALS